MSLAPDTMKKPSSGFSAQLLLDTIRLHPIAFVGLLVASLATCGVVYSIYPSPKNTAAVIFHLSGNAPRVINPIGENATDLKSFQQVQSGLVKRRSVLLTALKDPEASKAAFLQNQPNPVDWLDQNLKIDFKTGPQFMRVYLEGNHPEDMIAVLKAITAAYLSELDQRDNSGRIAKLKSIEGSILSQKAAIESYQKDIDKIAVLLHSTDEKTLMLVEDSLREELRTARRTKSELQLQLELAKRDLPLDILTQLSNLKEDEAINYDKVKLTEPIIAENVIEEQLRLHPQILEAERQVTLAKDNLKSTQAPLEKNAVTLALTKAQNDVAKAESALAKATGDIRLKLIEAAKGKAKIDQKNALTQYVDKYIRISRNLDESTKREKDVEKDLQKHGSYRYDLEKLRKEITHNEKSLDQLRDEDQKVRIEERAPKRVEILEEPFAMAGVEGFKALRASVLAGGGLFGLGIGLLVFWENRLRRVNRTEDLSSLGLQILGTLPPLQESGDTPNIELMEAVDSTRTLLLRAHSADRSVRVMAVTSGIPGEGKTYLSGQLAISLARAGYRTLLVDGDVHAPRIHDIFKVQPGPGLCEVLRDEVPLGSAIQTCDVTGLFIMPAGNWSMTARQYLVGNRWLTLRKDLESQFDFVVLDTAPLLMMTDTMLLALRVDGVVLSVLAGLSRMAPITQTKERLESLGVRVLGIVVNGVQSRFPGYNYGQYANKYSARYQSADPAPLALTPATDDRMETKSP